MNRSDFSSEKEYYEEILKRAVMENSTELLKDISSDDILNARKYMEKKLEEIFRNLKRRDLDI